MRLYVTQKDFNEGVGMDCRLCPVGRSAKRAAVRHGYNLASVGPDTMYFELLTEDRTFASVTLRLPEKVGKFIRAFDSGFLTARTFKPFSFEIQDITKLTAGNPGQERKHGR